MSHHQDRLDALNYHRDRLIEVAKDMREAVRELRRGCKHGVVIERHLGGGHAQRRCLSCALFEDGHNGGFNWLRDDDSRTVKEVSKDDFYRARQLFTIEQPGERFLIALPVK